MQVGSITGDQIRAARAALKWSVQELAKRTGVGTATIVRYEENAGVPPSRKNNLSTIQFTLEQAGIEFVGSPDDAPGIRIHGKPEAPTD